MLGLGQRGNGGADTDAATPTLVSHSMMVAGLHTGGDSTCAGNYAATFVIAGDYTPGAGARARTDSWATAAPATPSPRRAPGWVRIRRLRCG